MPKDEKVKGDLLPDAEQAAHIQGYDGTYKSNGQLGGG